MVDSPLSVSADRPARPGFWKRLSNRIDAAMDEETFGGYSCAAADRPVENSELREALNKYVESVICAWVSGSALEQVDSEREARSKVEELFASLQQENERLRRECSGWEDIAEADRAEISRLISERAEIAQEFGVSTDFDLGEHARVVMASLDDFKAELSRLRAIGEVR